MLKWQKAYEEYLNIEDTNSEIKILDNEVDSILRNHIPTDIFDELYDKIAKVEAFHNEDGFHKGFNMGILDTLMYLKSKKIINEKDSLKLLTEILEITI